MTRIKIRRECTYLETLICGVTDAQNDANPPTVRATLTQDKTRNIKLNRIAGGMILQGCGRLESVKNIKMSIFCGQPMDKCICIWSAWWSLTCDWTPHLDHT